MKRWENGLDEYNKNLKARQHSPVGLLNEAELKIRANSG
jgi:hypothetical protein